MSARPGNPSPRTEPRETRLRRLRAAWGVIPGNHRGAIWMLIGATGFTLNGALVKLLGAGGMHPFEISFGRSLVALLAMLPFIWRAGPGVLRSNHLRIHLARGAAGGTAMICAFYALTKIPLADFTALSFTTPLFILLLAGLLLGERVGPRRWGAVAVGFLGVLVMTRPGAGAVDPNALWVLVMALGISIAVVLVKRLPPSESQVTMLSYFCLISMAMSALPAALVWRLPTATEALLLTAVGTLGIGLPVADDPGLPRRRGELRGTLRIQPPAVRRGARVFPVRRGAGPLVLPGRRDHRRRHPLSR